jgi:hypothetical protein
MDTVCFFETLASTYDSTRPQNPEERHHPHRREKLKIYNIFSCRAKKSEKHMGG